MDFEAFFAGELDAVRADGRYRVFTDIKRHRGRFPHATRFRSRALEAQRAEASLVQHFPARHQCGVVRGPAGARVRRIGARRGEDRQSALQALVM